MNEANIQSSNTDRRRSPPSARIWKQYVYSLVFGTTSSLTFIIISFDQFLFGSSYALPIDFILVPFIGLIFWGYVFRIHIRKIVLGYISSIRLNKIFGDILTILSIINIILSFYESFYLKHSLAVTSYQTLLMLEIPSFFILLFFSSIPYRDKWFNPHVSSAQCEIPDVDGVLRMFPNVLETYGESLDPELKRQILRRQGGTE